MEDAQALAVQNNCHFAEISAAEDVEGVALTLSALFREVRTLKSQRMAVRQKRPTLMNVTKLFSSLIGRSNSSPSGGDLDMERERLKSISSIPMIKATEEEVKKDIPPEKETKQNKGIRKRPSFTL